MKRLIILMLALMPLATALADKPNFLPEKYIREMPWGPMPFMNCHDVGMGMDFWIWVEGVTIDEGKMFFDKDGTPIKTVSAYYTSEAFTWVPANPICEAEVLNPVDCPELYEPKDGTNTHSADQNLGRAEHQQAIYRDWIWVKADNPDGGFWYPTWGQLSGLNLHIGIPGYGNIFANAGHMKQELVIVPEGPYWRMISMTPNWEHKKAKDVFAMCSYHANQ
jgi:hypothetical protein